MDKKKQAQEISETLLKGMENDTTNTSTAIMQCLRIARLVGDADAILWLQYELGGYPQTSDGKIERAAFEIAYKNGRGSKEGEQRAIFSSLASELETLIKSSNQALSNYTTSGASVSGEWGATAMANLTRNVAESTNNLLKSIAKHEKSLAILRGKYYDYALKMNIELSFSNVVADIFDGYKHDVDLYFNKLSSSTILKLQAINDNLLSNDNPETLSQAITTCRRLFEDTANELFRKHFPNYSTKLYKTVSGKEIDVSDEHYLNKLSAVIDLLTRKPLRKTLIGSSVLFALDYIENISNLHSKGVHTNVTQEEALKCILHTYICLGDVLRASEQIDDGNSSIDFE